MLGQGADRAGAPPDSASRQGRSLGRGAIALTPGLDVLVWRTITPVEALLPRNGFAAIREIHIMTADISRLRERLDLLRLDPNSAEAMAKVAEANDLVHIRFFRRGLEAPVAGFRADGPIMTSIRAAADRIDRMVAAGPPIAADELAAAIATSTKSSRECTRRITASARARRRLSTASSKICAG